MPICLQSILKDIWILVKLDIYFKINIVKNCLIYKWAFFYCKKTQIMLSYRWYYSTDTKNALFRLEGEKYWIKVYYLQQIWVLFLLNS